MKVKELIEELQKLNPESEVILQRDSEGNGYSPAVGAEEAKYLPQSTYSGECYHLDDIEELDEEELQKLQTVVVIWPVN